MLTHSPATRSYPIATISMNAAFALLRAAIDEARSRDLAISAAIIDAGGSLKAFTRMDGAELLTIELATDKAWTALSFTMPTHTWSALIAEDASVAALAGRGRVVAVGGGIAILDGGAKVGAIGISGGTAEQDRAIAEAALEAWRVPPSGAGAN